MTKKWREVQVMLFHLEQSVTSRCPSCLLTSRCSILLFTKPGQLLARACWSMWASAPSSRPSEQSPCHPYEQRPLPKTSSSGVKHAPLLCSLELCWIYREIWIWRFSFQYQNFWLCSHSFQWCCSPSAYTKKVFLWDFVVHCAFN